MIALDATFADFVAGQGWQPLRLLALRGVIPSRRAPDGTVVVTRESLDAFAASQGGHAFATATTGYAIRESAQPTRRP